MAHSQRKPRGHATVTVFGRRAVEEAFEACKSERVSIERVRIANDLPASYHKQIQQLCRDQHGKQKIEYEVVPRVDVHAVTNEPRHDQGIAALVHLFNVVDLDDYLDRLKGRGARDPARVLALDAITNPQNIGLVIRSAVAFGAGTILWPTKGVPWIEGLVIKASASTLYQATIIPCEYLADGLTELASSGFRLAGLDSHASVDLDVFESSHRQVFVLGSETQGISEEVDPLLDDVVRIPMMAGVESLNVAVSAAVVCYAMSVRTNDSG
ncbi:MAG: RNA methyltransferase [Planctomycetota bacterium]